MLDVHVLVSADTRKDWVDQCLRSVELAIDLAAYDIQLFVEPGIPGHIGKARQRAYSKGNAEWKTYVDDDDYLLPTAFIDLGKYLNEPVAAIFTREQPEQNGRFHPFTTPDHHLQVYRKDIVQEYDHDMVSMSDVWCKELAMRDPRGFLSVDDVTYVHRVYWDSKARQLRRANPNERQLLVEKFR